MSEPCRPVRVGRQMRRQAGNPQGVGRHHWPWTLRPRRDGSKSASPSEQRLGSETEERFVTRVVAQGPALHVTPMHDRLKSFTTVGAVLRSGDRLALALRVSTPRHPAVVEQLLDAQGGEVPPAVCDEIVT